MHSSPGDISEFRRVLLSWYDQNRRDLPWRKSQDPYRIWVSEIMLQQTRVAAVLPKYERFLQRFPSIKKLAAARESSVLAEWSGLGYYRRARNLHCAAKVITREGKFPNTSEQWRALPGIGRYTAAAIASIAFNEPVAVLDGNVERVLSRISKSCYTKAAAWDSAQALLDPERPGDFNQAMMELGAVICVPGEPICQQCPIHNFCRTRGRGRVARSKPRQLKRKLSYVLSQKSGSVLMVRRSQQEGLMPGMWELPSCKNSKRNPVLFRVKHSITATDYAIPVIVSRRRQPEGTWVKVSRLNALPLTGLARKILRAARIIL